MDSGHSERELAALIPHHAAAAVAEVGAEPPAPSAVPAERPAGPHERARAPRVPHFRVVGPWGANMAGYSKVGFWAAGCERVRVYVRVCALVRDFLRVSVDVFLTRCARRTRCRLTTYPIYVPTAELEPAFGAPSAANEAVFWTHILAYGRGAPDPATPPAARAAWATTLAYVTQLVTSRSAYPFCGVNGSDVAPDGQPYSAAPGVVWETPRDCVWPIDYSDHFLCSTTGAGLHTCASGGTCASNYDDLGNPRFANARFMGSDVRVVEFGYGQQDFDNIYDAFLAVSLATTTSGWTDLLYQVCLCVCVFVRMCVRACARVRGHVRSCDSPTAAVARVVSQAQDTTGGVWPAVYWVSITLLTNWLMVNLTLAVLYHEFTVGAARTARAKERAAREAAERAAVRSVASRSAKPSLRRLQGGKRAKLAALSALSSGHSSAMSVHIMRGWSPSDVRRRNVEQDSEVPALGTEREVAVDGETAAAPRRVRPVVLGGAPATEAAALAPPGQPLRGDGDISETDDLGGTFSVRDETGATPLPRARTHLCPQCGGDVWSVKPDWCDDLSSHVAASGQSPASRAPTWLLHEEAKTLSGSWSRSVHVAASPSTASSPATADDLRFGASPLVRPFSLSTTRAEVLPAGSAGSSPVGGIQLVQPSVRQLTSLQRVPETGDGVGDEADVAPASPSLGTAQLLLAGRFVDQSGRPDQMMQQRSRDMMNAQAIASSASLARQESPSSNLGASPASQRGGASLASSRSIGRRMSDSLSQSTTPRNARPLYRWFGVRVRCLDGATDAVFRVVHAAWTQRFIVFCIVANTVVLSLDKYPAWDNDTANVMELVNFAFTVIFALECAALMMTAGVRAYVKEPFNVLDMVIVTVSILELAFTPPAAFTAANDAPTGSTGATALRGLRLFRMLRLAKNWASLRSLLATIARTVLDLGNFSLLLVLLIYIMSLVGMQLFANRMRFDANTNLPILNMSDPAWNLTVVPRTNWDTLINAKASCFQVCVRVCACVCARVHVCVHEFACVGLYFDRVRRQFRRQIGTI